MRRSTASNYFYMVYFYASDEVFDLEISGHAKLILLNLCRRADKNGLSFPSEKTVVRDCGISTKTVYRCISELESKNLIIKKKTFNRSSKYILSDKLLNIRSTANSRLKAGTESPTKDYTEKEYTYKETDTGKNLNSFNRKTDDEMSADEIERWMRVWRDLDMAGRKDVDSEIPRIIPTSPIQITGGEDPVLNRCRGAILKRRSLYKSPGRGFSSCMVDITSKTSCTVEASVH